MNKHCKWCTRLEAHTPLDFRDNSSSHLFPRFHITNVQNSLRTPHKPPSQLKFVRKFHRSHGTKCTRLEAHTTLDFRDNSSSHLFPRFHITNVQNSLRTPQVENTKVMFTLMAKLTDRKYIPFKRKEKIFSLE